MIGRSPIPDAHAMLLHAFDPPDSSRKVGTQEPAIRRFVGESANGSKPQVDSGGGILSLFEVDPVARHHGLVEGEAGFRAVPVDEFTDRMVIRALGAVGGQTVKDLLFSTVRDPAVSGRFWD